MTIKSRIKKFANNFLDLFDILIEKKSRVSRLLNNELFIRDFGLLKYIKEHNMRVKYIENLNYSKSQLRQDLFVLNELGYKRKGYFVEFGAANGLYISNTYLLEKKFEWVGLLSEPAKFWHKELINNRKCMIE